VDASGQPGVMFNYPDAPLMCSQGVVTQSGEAWCTMVPVDPFDPASGCYYQVGGTCSITGRTMHPEDRPPYLVEPPGWAVCATGDVHIENCATVTDSTGVDAGHVAAGGDLTVRNAASIEGSVLVGDDLLMCNAASIAGDAHVGGSVSVGHHSSIGGTVSETPWPGDICTCGHDLDADFAFATEWNDNQRLYDDPEIARHLHDGALVVDHCATVTLPTGDYLLTGLELRHLGRLTAAPGAHVRLYVTGAVMIENHTRLDFPPAEGARLDIISSWTGTHRLVNASDSTIYIYSPRAHVCLRNAADLYGGLTAASVRLENAGHVVRLVEPTDDPAMSLTCQWGY
jgi:hypothetical protein